ncbi:MAG: PAS domain S-box protein [Sulfurimonadaceae bacterium]
MKIFNIFTKVDKKFSSFISFGNQDKYYLYRKKTLDSCEIQSCEIRILRKDGTSFWAHLMGKLLDGNSIYTIICDITERKEMQKELDLKEEMMLAKSKQIAA